MKALLFLPTAALTVSACCSQLPDLLEVAFRHDSESDADRIGKSGDRKVTSLEEAVDELKTASPRPASPLDHPDPLPVRVGTTDSRRRNRCPLRNLA